MLAMFARSASKRVARSFSSLGAKALAVSACVVVTAASSAIAGDVVVGGPLGQTWKGDTFDGNFNYYTCGCNGQITSITQNSEHVFIGDEWGLINQFDRDTGNLLNIYSVNGPITAMAMHRDEILAAHIDGTIDRVSPHNGQKLGAFTSPIQVQAMLCEGDTVYVSGPSQDVWKGDLTTGEFEYFACACSTAVHAMTKDNTHLYVGDDSGLITGYRLSDGEPERFFGTGNWVRITALEIEDGDLLAAELSGQIIRIDPVTTQVLGSVFSPIQVEAMLLIGETGPGYPLQLNITNLIAGENASIVVEGGTSGQQGIVMWSFDSGSLALNNGTWCVDFEIDLPANELNKRIAVRGVFSPSGQLARNRFIPLGLSGQTLLLQAAESNTCPEPKMSNVFQAPVL
jgi:hypothetical protein